MSPSPPAPRMQPSSRRGTAFPKKNCIRGRCLSIRFPFLNPCGSSSRDETETRVMHALEEYGLMHVKLYEDIARNGRISTTYAYPVKVAGRYVMDPSPTPKFDNPKMHLSDALQLFGAGREKRIYAVPPYTDVVSTDFEDHPFEIQSFDKPCALCGGRMSIWTRWCWTTRAGGCSSAPTPTIAKTAAPMATRAICWRM